MGQTRSESSGVGVLDKAVSILESARHGATLAELVERSGLPRATAHRLAQALAVHGLLARDVDGRWHPGTYLTTLAGAAHDELLDRAGTVLAALRDHTGESAQLYRRHGEERICVAAADRVHGLRDSVPVGAALTMTAGSAAQVLLAWGGADSTFDDRVLAEVRRRGWAQSVGERESGVASVSAPVRDAAGRVVAAVSVSGPIDRLGRRPGSRLAAAVVAAGQELSDRS